MRLLESEPDLFYSTIMGKKIICFGAGKMPVDAIKALSIRDNISFFYDNAREKWDTLVGADGKTYEVHDPAEIGELHETNEIVFLITNRDYYLEILKQLNSFENINDVAVFIYPQFNLKDVYAFQKTEKFILMKKYEKSVRLKRKEQQINLGFQLLNYLFDVNMFFAKKIGDMALQNQKRVGALRIYAKLINSGYDNDLIYKLILENYTVREEETNSLFVKNMEILSTYPYFWGTKVDGVKTKWLNFQEGNSIFPYNSESGLFGNEIIVREPQNAFCHLEDNGKPVFLKNIYNEWVLIYLFYIVRDSEKYGADNHIYLYYENADEFYNLLRFIDLSYVKENNKFVFMLGKESIVYYPLNRGEFERKKEPEMLSIDEMQHICLLASNGICGSGFFTGVMTSNMYVVGNEDKSFYYYSQLPKNFHDILQDVDRSYTYQEVLSGFENNIGNIEMPMDDKPFVEYVRFFRENYREEDIFTVVDIWKIYFIAKYYMEGGLKNTRFVPCMFWDVHTGSRSDYEKILSKFKIKDFLIPIRNPIIKLVRYYDWRAYGTTFENHYDDLSVKFTSGFDQRFGYPDAFNHKCIAVKFEDCKLYPQEMFKKICYALCIPYQDSMLNAEARDSAAFEGNITRGFDLAPLNRKIDHVFSTLDKVKLEIFYSQINEHYGYDFYDFDEQPITDEEVERLFSIPFRMESNLFDKFYTRAKEDREWKRTFDYKNTNLLAKKIWFDSKEELHEFLQKILMKGYKISRYENIKFPFFIRKSVQGSEFEEFINE